MSLETWGLVHFCQPHGQKQSYIKWAWVGSNIDEVIMHKHRAHDLALEGTIRGWALMKVDFDGNVPKVTTTIAEKFFAPPRKVLEINMKAKNHDL